MTPEEYWNGEGIRFLREDGTAPSVEDRVKEGFRRGLEVGACDYCPFDLPSDVSNQVVS